MNPTHQLWLLLLTVAVTGSQDLTDTEPDSGEETVPESTLSSSDEIPEKPKVQLQESNGNVHSESDAVNDSQPVNAASGDPADKHSGSPESNGNVHSESDAVNDSQPVNAASGDPADKHSGSPARCVKPSGDGILSVSDPESGEYYAPGESVTLQCDAGYYPPSRPVTCGAGGRWNVPARCVAQCEKPAVDKLILDPDRKHYNDGESVTVRCEAGYVPFLDTIRCGGSSEWDQSPSCIAQCTKPTGPGIYSINLYTSNGYSHTSYQEYYHRENKILVQCKAGYSPLYSLYTCQGSGSGSDWDSPVSCTAQCAKPTGPGISSISLYTSNGYINTNNQEYYNRENQIRVRCQTGYYPLSSTYTCQDRGSGSDWDSPVSCIAQCTKPTGPGIYSISLYTSNGYSHTSYQEYYHRENKILVQCQTGYYPSSSTYTCQGSGSGSDWDRPVSCTAQCTKPTGPGISSINGYINTNNQKPYYNPSDQITVRCQTGYYPSSRTYTCQDRGSGSDWDSPVSCIALCKTPTGRGIDTISKHPPNYDQNYYRGNKILVRCQTGYYPSSSTYTCQGSGSGSDWDSPVSCIAQCAKPTGPGIYIISRWSGSGYINTNNQEHYNPSDQITVWCQTGYSPSSSSYTCQDRGSGSDWDSPVSCTEQCSAPAGAGIQSVDPDTMYYNPGATATVRCSAGYHSASPQIMCQTIGRNWSVTVPCVKIQVTGLDITSNSISFRWRCEPDPCQEYWEFDVSCCLIQQGNKWNQCQDRKLDEGHTEFHDLQPASVYDITIYGKHSGLTRRRLQTWRNRTREAAPEKPKLTKPIGENVIKWTLSSSRGAITGYEMNVSAWRDYNKSFTETGSYWFPPNVTQFKLEMKNGTNYTIYLRGFTSAGAGKPTQWSHETPIADPPVPPVRLHKVLSTSVTTAELALHPVPDIHGPISSYEVIISAGNGDNSSDLCAGYTSTHYNSSSSPHLYTAALIPARNVSEPTTLTLGDGRRYSDFFNAPLHAGKQYSVSVRVTSAWREVEKSSCVEYSRFTVREPRNVPVAAMAGVGVAVFMLLILVVLLVLWKRGLLRLMGQKSLKTRGIPLKKHDGSGKKKTIPVENFLEIVKNFRSKELMVQEESEEENSNMLPVGRYSEYKELPPGLLYPCNVATLEENISKNRYKKVIPYDNSRVRLLSGSSGSDYINASYVDGYKAPQYFIATQGPLPGTVADFWHMVWQEKSSVIVMLTGLEEKNKVKCACYWPEQGETYGDITIYLQKVKQTGATITRSFILRKSGVQRVVEHFHYLQWPDHGVPSKHSGLLQVVEQMHICNVPGSGPVIVHCSAGIGRTGTFIALDILLKMGRAENKVNVFTCTSQLRRSRTNMVQDKEQYVFLYNILLETLLCGVTSVAVEDIQVHIHRMGELDPVTKISGYMKEFQELEKLRGLYHIGSYKEGEKPENLAKNRYCSILPGDGCRPILISVSNKQGLPGYINAVFINSNLLNDAFVVTQLPLKQTLGDFWSLVWDYKCTSVVLMHDPPDMSEMTAQFWPEKGEARYGGFIVKKISKVLATGHKEITLCVRPCNEPVDSSLKVKLYQLTIWPKNQSVPLNPSAFIGLIGKLEQHQQQMEGSHVLVTCCDGASRSGLLCAGAIVCDQIRSDGCLDVSQAVRSLKKRRVQLIPSPEQYVFCYTLAQSYLDSFETYGNFTH